MKQNKWKRRLASALAAAMAVTMAAPAGVAFGAVSVLKFDPQAGPDLSYSTYKNIPAGADKTVTITGSGGKPLTDLPEFAGIKTETLGVGPRPKLPEFTDAVWPGYTFEGWYDSEDKPVANLPYTMPYDKVNTYKAKWVGDSNVTFRFTVMHYRDFNADRNGNQDGRDPSAWPASGDTQAAMFFKNSDWERQVSTETPISAVYKRNIPGYTVDSVLMKNNWIRGYGEESGNGRFLEAASITATTKTVKGIMPNDDLTVAYRYKPDPTKEFVLRVEYVDKNGTAIQNPTTSKYGAESDLSVSPVGITAYILESAAVKSGFGDEDDLAGKGIYSAAAAGCKFDSQKRFVGKMPNQPVTLTYVYKMDSNYKSAVIINTVDNHNNVLKQPQTLQVSAGDTKVLDVERIKGYLYPPNIKAEGGVSEFHMDKDTGKLTFKAGITGSSISFTYNEDLNDSDLWGRIEYVRGRNGSLTGDASARAFRLGTYPLSELTAGIDPSAQANYVFDGWYLANEAGTDKVGQKLSGDLTVSKNMKLYANFVEDPNTWFDLSFQSGSHGTLSGAKSFHVEKGTLWGNLSLPNAIPDSKYMFEGWFDEKGNKITDSNMKILANQKVTARFRLISDTEGGLYAIPDVQAQVALDGQGKITIKGVNEVRKYVLTDHEGKILASMTGHQAKTESFHSLPPCRSYLIYEADESAIPILGDSVEHCVDPGKISQPSMAVVPAIGDNYSAQSHEDGTGSIVISPAVSGMVYGIMDENGNALAPEGSHEGWMTPSGKPLSVAFTGLEVSALYTVVAKAAGDSAQAADLVLKGSSVRIPFSIPDKGNEYEFRIEGGGYLESVTRSGVSVPLEGGQTIAMLKEGDQIKINASRENDDGFGFKQWNVLLGGLKNEFPTQKNQTVTMPEGNVLIQSVYENPNSPYLNVSVDYSPKNSGFAIKAEGEALETLKAQLTNNAADTEALAANQEIEYTFKFGTRAVLATESNAVKENSGAEDVTTIHWAMDLTLGRKLEGTTKPIPSDADPSPQTQVYMAIKPEIAVNQNLQLWGLTKNPDGGFDVDQIAMEPDPNDEDGEFTGMVSFEARVGETYVLSSQKTYQVAVVDNKRGTGILLGVKPGDSLEETKGYEELAFHENYTDPISGFIWTGLGLSKTESGKKLYDVSQPVTGNLTLYAIYESREDEQWQAAKKDLTHMIDTANALANHTLVSQEDRERLKTAVEEAVAILNSLPQPTTEDLTDTCIRLGELVDGVRNSNPGSEDDEDDWLDAKGRLEDVIESAEDLRNQSGISKTDQKALAQAIKAAEAVFATLPRPSISQMEAAIDALNNLIREIKDHINNGGGSGDSGGSSSSGGGSGGGGGSSRNVVEGSEASRDNGYRTYTNGTEGRWNSDDGGKTWEFLVAGQTPVRSQWINVRFHTDGREELLTFHLNADGKADSGWYGETDGIWYYLSDVNDGTFGHVVKGWYLSPQDGHWYYLNEFTGSMSTGWRKVGDKWYYLSDGRDGRPQGSMYHNETTPDGYPVGGEGDWIREIPN